MGRSHEVLIKACHDLVANGEIEVCRSYLATGECLCCQEWHENWIGLVPGERAILNKESTAEWIDFKAGIQCRQDPTRCSPATKPLDCKIYPFFPYDVADEGDQYRVYVGAAHDRCAAKSLVTALKGKTIVKGSSLPFGKHLYTVGRIGAALYQAGLGDWMKETFTNFVGYNDGYVVIVNKEDVLHLS